MIRPGLIDEIVKKVLPQDIDDKIHEAIVNGTSMKISLDENQDIVAEVIEPEEIFYYPTQAEVNKQVEENHKNDNLQNQTHGTICDNCIKAHNNTPNPKALMRYCSFNGVMVSKFNVGCDKFKERAKDSFGL